MLRNQRSRIRNLNSSKKSLALATQRVDPVINLSMVNFEPQKQLQLNDSKEIIFTSNNSQVNLSEFNNTRNNTQVIEGNYNITPSRI